MGGCGKHAVMGARGSTRHACWASSSHPSSLYSSPRFLKVALAPPSLLWSILAKDTSVAHSGVLMPFSPPSKFYPPEGPGWMKPSQVPQRQNESLPHCLLAPQPIAHSIKTLMKLCWCYSVYYPAPLCYLLHEMKSRSLFFLSPVTEIKSLWQVPARKWFCAAQSAVGEVRAVRTRGPSLTLLPPPWMPEVIQQCCLAVFLWRFFTAVCSLLVLHGDWTQQAHCTRVS